VRRHAIARRIALVVAPLLGLALAGCIPLYYAYPVVATVPSVKTDAPADQVRAFRVDVADEENCVDFDETDRYVFREVPLGPSGKVPGQAVLALDHGWYWNFIALIYEGHTRHTVLVRAYRPGWRTVEIKPGWKHEPIRWVEAADADAREQAIDDLLSTWDTDFQGYIHAHCPKTPPRDASVFRSLATGSASSAHREVLRFGAAEYERLAEQLGTGEAVQTQRLRLTDKARALREMAER
jgi:hypothetical protein